MTSADSPTWDDAPAPTELAALTVRVKDLETGLKALCDAVDWMGTLHFTHGPNWVVDKTTLVRDLLSCDS